MGSVHLCRLHMSVASDSKCVFLRLPPKTLKDGVKVCHTSLSWTRWNTREFSEVMVGHILFLENRCVYSVKIHIAVHLYLCT